MTMDLFIEPTPVEKTAAEVALSEDPNGWPNEIMQELYKQVPYVSDFEPTVIMDRVDAERGYGFGHVEVMNKSEVQRGASPEGMEAAGIRQVRIPVVVREHMLQPLDVLVTDDSKMLPLTEMRLRQAVFRPQAFDITGRTPGDMSMIGQLYPPYRQNYGFGGGGATMSVGMGKESAKLAAMRERLKEAAAKSEVHHELKGHARSLLGGAAGGAAATAAMDALARKKVDFSTLGKAGLGAAGGGLVAGLADLASGGWKDLKKADRRDERAERLRKVAVSYQWVMDKARSGAAKASPSRLKGFADKMDAAATRNFKLHNQRGSDLARAAERTVEHTKKASLLETILPTVNEADYIAFFDELKDPGLQAAYIKNAHATAPALSKLASCVPVTAEKTASALPDLIRPTVAQVRRGDDGYVLKTASHKFWAPLYQNLDRGELVRRFGEKVALATDMNGAVTMVEGAQDAVDPEADRPELVHDFGLYKVQDSEGRELVGFVLPNLIDLDGAALPLALFTNGSQAAIQGEIAGVRSGEGTSLPSADAPSGNGCFYRVLPNGKAQATVPMNIQGGLGEGETGASLLAETFDGRQVELHLGQPNLERITEGPNGDVLVPAAMKWLPLGAADEVELVSDPTLFGKAEEAKEAAIAIEIRAGGLDNFSLSGMLTDKLASAEKDFLSTDDVLFVLGGFGIDPAAAIPKLAQSYGQSRPERVYASRIIKHASEQVKEAHTRGAEALEKLPNLKQNLVKEAASIPDPMAVDTVLSLGFINPENLTSFVASLPKIEEAQNKLCEILMAARLGLQEVPTSPLERAIHAVEEVIEGLKVLAFQGPVGE